MSKIEWTDETWNPLAGCSLVSPGTNCYAMGFANRLLDKPGSHYEGTTKRVNGKAVWTGKVTRAPDQILTQPLRWTRPRMVFVNSMSDLFHEDVPDEWIDEIFAVMAMCPQHTFQILTKRPERMRAYCNGTIKEGVIINNPVFAKYLPPLTKETKCEFFVDENGHPKGRIDSGYEWQWPLGNVWLGVSVEDQRRANERIPHLLHTPAAVRFLSMEPLIGGVDLNGLAAPAIKDPDKVPMVKETALYTAKDRPAILPAHDLNKIDWVIVGGESGPDARPMHPDWVRFTRDQCETAGTRFFFKQWGHWAPLADHEGRKDWMIVDHQGGVDVPDDRWPDETLGEVAMVAVGKGKAGRALDGKEWNQMPERAIL
jgi:protein gp37